ncbi:MAG: phospho-N-acetylmuramoyl-pentapeptide-transferase [Coriobacteriales bacterium]|jgi:phospho-N-acetylmuramoyl-pentapeptide-transferase
MFSLFSAYPTYQAFLAFIVSMALTMIVMPFFIKLLKVRQIGQQVRADGPEGHLVKQGTPTMGGIVILLMMTISIFLVGTPDAQLLLVLAATLLTGLLGFIDDASKVAKERSLGLLPYQKMIALTIISVGFCLIAVNYLGIEPYVTIPFANFDLDLGVLTTVLPIGDGFSIPWLYVLFIFILMAGMSNAVNLTDGLDGLAGGTIMIVMFAMAAIAFQTQQLDLSVFACAAAGACVGFLWFNCYPANIFMGDTGSLALGTAFAAIAVMTKTELFSVIIGGLFVVEVCSVIIQVVHYKRTKKRVFLMAPLHHHYEKKGWPETRVVIRFWIITGLFAGFGFAIYFMSVI